MIVLLMMLILLLPLFDVAGPACCWFDSIQSTRLLIKTEVITMCDDDHDDDDMLIGLCLLAAASVFLLIQSSSGCSNKQRWPFGCNLHLLSVDCLVLYLICYYGRWSKFVGNDVVDKDMMKKITEIWTWLPVRRRIIKKNLRSFGWSRNHGTFQNGRCTCFGMNKIISLFLIIAPPVQYYYFYSTAERLKLFCTSMCRTMMIIFLGIFKILTVL